MMNMMNDIYSNNQNLNALVQAYCEGDKEAFTGIYMACQKISKNVYDRKLSEEQRSRFSFDELFQDAVTKVWNFLESRKAFEGDFRPWFKTVFWNTFLSEYRKAGTHAYTELSFVTDAEIRTTNINDFVKQGTAEEVNPSVSKLRNFDQELIEDVFAKGETLDGILKCMEQVLSVEQNEAMYMFYFEKKSVAEIAQIQECSENSVKSRLHQGRNKLRTPFMERGLAS